MRIITTTTAIAGLALAAAALGACGSAEDSGTGAAGGYCQELKTDKVFFQSLEGSDPDLAKLEAAFSRIHTLADTAPPGLAESWATLDDAVTTMEDAFDEAGIDPEDLEAMQEGEIPAGVDLDKLAAMAPQMQAFDGPEFEEAAVKIAEHAKSECGIDLPAA